jgi:hypothetical protein
MFNAHDYKILSDIVFHIDEEGNPTYPGYRPNVVESPNGDKNWDTEKRYAHVATKYLEPYNKVLMGYLHRAHNKAMEVAIELGIPKEFWPDIRYGALRVLEYPPGAVTHPHKDFDLFTLMMYRNTPEDFKYLSGKDVFLMEAQQLNDQIHFGEILETLIPAYKANEHEVVADIFGRTQYSIVYFAIPDRAAVLPTGQTVGEWLEERLSRSRKQVGE